MPIATPLLRIALFFAFLSIFATPARAQVVAGERTGKPAGTVAKPVATAKPAVLADTVAPVKIKPMRDYALYRAEVSLTSQGASERKLATARALSQVIVKLTGNPQAPTNTTIRKALANAQAYVSEATEPVAASDSEGNTAIGGVPVFKTTMQVTFEATSIDALIATAGLKYWTGVRPKPILWLAIDDGRGPRLVNGQQLSVIKPLATRGLERGIRFGLPQGTAAEAAAVGAIWNLDSAALAGMTARYQGNDAQLIGKIYRSVSGWSAWWVLSQAGVELGRWPVTDADPRKVIGSGADPVADAIAKRDAVYLETGPAGAQTVEITGVRSQADFIRVMAYLQTLAIVKRVQIDAASDDGLQLTLELGVGLRGFTTMLATGDTLEPEPADTASDDALPRFRLK